MSMSATHDDSITPLRIAALVIGAGPAGLAIGACLHRAHVPFRMVEAGGHVGEAWHHRYARLHLHTVKRYSALPFMPFPTRTPRYPSREQVIAYLETYARHFDLHPSFRQSVLSTRYQDGEWETVTSTTTYRSRFLIVCTGGNRQPIIPRWGGEEDFRGTLLHSGVYDRAAPFRGQRVLVVGLGNSGAEIALDLCEGGAETTIAVRGGVNIVPRDPLGIPIQVLSIFAPSARPQLTDVLMRPLWRRLVGDLRPLGLTTPPYGPAVSGTVHGRIPVIDVGTARLLQARRIRVRGAIAQFTADGVVFTDGSEAPFDAVVLATGFHPALDAFLPQAAAVTDERGYPLAHGQSTALPGLYFCGFHNVPTGLLREIGREAKGISHAIARQMATAPEEEEQRT